MQRLGFLKAVCALVNETETSNLESLGRRLIARVTQRIKLAPPFAESLQEYARTRLTDGAYRGLRKTILDNSGSAGVELQDIYLADKGIPSSTGKLVETNWRRYPYLGTSLELVKRGTYSPMTRSLVLLALTPKEELTAFGELDREHNPLGIRDGQAIVFLYCLLDNDAEVAVPLLQALSKLGDGVFDERHAGDLLPGILRVVVVTHGKKSLTAEEKDRIAALGKIATNVENWKGKTYTGSGAREEAVRVRLEPYCDLGLLAKPTREKYDYRFTEAARTLLNRCGDCWEIEKFLQQGFFAAFAACRRIDAKEASEAEATEALAKAGETLKSSLGYTPITDVGLLAGARLLTERRRILELGRTVELLKSLQKQDPDFVRFTVDRMGALAYVKFLKSAPGS
jgi:hypothetical protein